MAERKIEIRKSKGAPEVQVLIGGANLGSYSVELWDSVKGVWKMVREGANNDPILDRFPLPGPVANLDKMLLRWTITIDSLTGKDGDRYQAVVSISQKDTLLPGGLFPYDDVFPVKNGHPQQVVISQTVFLVVV